MNLKLILAIVFPIFSIRKYQVRYDGLYETVCNYEVEDDEGEQGYLRFYSDGTVISVGTSCDGSAEQLRDWFNLEMEYLRKGIYKIKGQKIEFSTTGVNGTVNYMGKIDKNGNLSLKVISDINGYKSREEYSFIQIDDLK
jgi:hypothetical protein